MKKKYKLRDIDAEVQEAFKNLPEEDKKALSVFSDSVRRLILIKHLDPSGKVPSFDPFYGDDSRQRKYGIAESEYNNEKNKDKMHVINRLIEERLLNYDLSSDHSYWQQKAEALKWGLITLGIFTAIISVSLISMGFQNSRLQSSVDAGDAQLNAYVDCEVKHNDQENRLLTTITQVKDVLNTGNAIDYMNLQVALNKFDLTKVHCSFPGNP